MVKKTENRDDRFVGDESSIVFYDEDEVGKDPKKFREELLRKSGVSQGPKQVKTATGRTVLKK